MLIKNFQGSERIREKTKQHSIEKQLLFDIFGSVFIILYFLTILELGIYGIFTNITLFYKQLFFKSFHINKSVL